MQQTLLVYGRRAYASELDLFRCTRVTATRAQALAVVGRTPAIIYRVSDSGLETLVPDLADVCRMISKRPEASVELIPVYGQSRFAH